MRFIINLPQEELESVARICFQVEEAQWFYEDFIRPIDPSLPSLNLKDFCLAIFQHCPLLSAFTDSQHLAAYQEFLGYKTRVPVRGAILLNHDMDQVLLVKGWKKGASWSFPRGKINKDEKDLDCAIREVYEETGYDVKLAGLADDPESVKAIDVTMREQHMRLFVFRDVPEDTHFEPRTRKEISVRMTLCMRPVLCIDIAAENPVVQVVGFAHLQEKQEQCPGLRTGSGEREQVLHGRSVLASVEEMDQLSAQTGCAASHVQRCSSGYARGSHA